MFKTNSNHQFRLWIWFVYLFLFTFSIAWYLPEVNPLPIWLGVPFWVVICLGMFLIIACFTIFVIYKFWAED